MCILGLLAASEAGVTAPQQVPTRSGVEMMVVPGGWFSMGDAKGEPDETPHKVYVSSFYMDKYLVTQKEYAKLMGKNPSRWKGEGNPVEQVRWSDAVRYCNERSKREGLRPCYDLRTWQGDFSADGYRLPTEAEWEYACRAGTTGRYSFGDSAAKLEIYAWFKDNAAGRPRPAGQKLPNPWGLFDMHGNVWEWVSDCWHATYASEEEKNAPTCKYHVPPVISSP